MMKRLLTVFIPLLLLYNVAISQLINNNSLVGYESYSQESIDVFNQMSTELPDSYKNAIDKFVKSQLKVSSIQWTRIIEFWLFANDTQTNSLIGWKNVVDLTTTNSPTFSSSYGFLLNGSTQYIGGFIPNTHAAGFDAKLAVGVFVKENLSTGNAITLLGTTLPGGAGRLELQQVPSSANISAYVVNSSAVTSSEGTNDDKIFDSETEYTTVQLAGTGYYYKDGILINSAARTNSGLSTIEMPFGCLNNNGTKLQHINAKLSAGYAIDPTGFDFRAFHLGLKQLLIDLGVYAETPELTIPSGGEWFDFSQDTPGTFVSLAGRKAAITAVASANAPNVETESGSGVQMVRFESASSEAIDLSSTFQTFYDGTLPASFSIAVTVKPIDGSPASEQAYFGHTNSTSEMYARLTTANKVKIGFKEPANAAINTNSDFEAFNNSPSNVSILVFEFLKDEMIVEVNGVKVNQTEGSWSTRALTDFVGGSINMYLGAENVDGVITRPFDGYIGDFMIRRGAWSQSQKERVYNYFQRKYAINKIHIHDMRGQSNGGGQGDISDDLPIAYQGAQTGVHIYYKTTRTSADDGNWETLTPGTNNHGDPATAGNDYFGVESKLMKDLKDFRGWNPYTIKSSIGGTSIVDHLNTGAAGPISDNYYFKPALSKIVKDGFPVLKFVQMIQGYSDCTSLSSSNAYAASLTTWSTERRTFLSSVIKSQTEFKLVVVESPDYIDGATDPAWVNTVQAAQLNFKNLAIRNNYSIAKPSVVTFNGGPTGIHWDGESLIRYSDLIFDIVKKF